MTTANVAILNIGQLIPFTLGNSRIHRSLSKRTQLRESIKAQGIIQPITVRPSIDSDDVFEVIAGFGRYEESQNLGLATIPALIKTMTDAEAFEAQLTENLVRHDLSLVDECKSAQRLVSLSEGSHFEAAQRLGWTTKKLADRLQLLRCCDEVLDSLNEERIKVGHAIILSSFTEKLQQGTLAKIIDEKWSVEYLKERSGRAKKYLYTAKFDKNGCNDCPHNTLPQNDMFDTTFKEKAMCSNLTCWKTKTTDWVAEQRKIAEEKYGKVLLFIESGVSDRSTVAPSVVGNEQYNSCVTCESRCAIIDDRDGREGTITESQCLNQVCFSKCEQTYNKSQEIPKKESNIVESKLQGKKIPSAKTVNSPQKNVVQKTPASVIERERELLKVSAYEELKGNSSLKQGMVIALLSELSGFKSDLLGNSTGFINKVLKCLDKDPQDLQKSIMESLTHYLVSAVKDDSNKNPIDLLIKTLATRDNAKEVAIKSWLADEKTLKNYTISGVIILCQESGFIEAFEKNTDNLVKKISFDKISKLSKSEFIKKVIEFGYDWSAYAPLSMLKHINA